MSLMDRLTRMVQADAHGVVDALEDRRLVLRQALREAEMELDRKRARHESLGAELVGLEERREVLASDVRAADGDVDLALKQGERELARFAARKMLGVKRELEGAEQRAAEVGKERDDLAKELERQESEFAELKQRVRSYLSRATDEGESSVSDGRGTVTDQDVELELLRRQDAVQGSAS